MIKQVVSLVLCLLVSFVFAQSAKSKKTDAAAKTEKAPASTAKIFVGAIVTIDQAKKTISIKVKSGDYPVAIAEKTAILAGEKQITLADLKTGDIVRVEYQKLAGGQREAISVKDESFKAKPEPAAAAAPKKEASTKQAEPAAATKAQLKSAPAETKAQAVAPVKPEPAAAPKSAPVTVQKTETGAPAKPAAKPDSAAAPKAEPAPAAAQQPAKPKEAEPVKK